MTADNIRKYGYAMMAAFLSVCAAVILAVPAAAQEQPADEQSMNVEQAVAEDVKVMYDYQSYIRRDPFVSIVEKHQMEGEKTGVVPPTPQQAYDLPDIILVAITKVESTEDYYALVRMPDGKHYVVRKGEKIGINEGIITDINEESFTVTEMVKDYRGDVNPKYTTLSLPQEEEQ